MQFKSIIVLLIALTPLCNVLVAQDKEKEGENDTSDKEILNKIENTKVSLNFKNETLESVIDYIRELVNINIVIDREAQDKLSNEKVTVKVNDLALKRVFDILLDSKDLAIICKKGVLMILPKEKALSEDIIEKSYDITDLLFKIQDFPAPPIDLSSPPQSDPSRARPQQWPRPWQTPSEKEQLSPDFIIDIIKKATGPSNWEIKADISIEILNNKLLVVRHNKKIHSEIVKLINRLREFK